MFQVFGTQQTIVKCAYWCPGWSRSVVGLAQEQCWGRQARRNESEAFLFHSGTVQPSGFLDRCQQPYLVSKIFQSEDATYWKLESCLGSMQHCTPSTDPQSLLTKDWLVALLITRHDIFKAVCPVCTTAAFLLGSDPHYAGFDNVADIMVSCLLAFPEMSYVCCYLTKQIPAHVTVTLREKRWKPSPMAFADCFSSTPLRMTI